MRFIFSLFALIAFAMPAMANDVNATQKPALIKGSKSYQVRYTKTDKAPEAIEPAAGDEANKQISPKAVGQKEKQIKIQK